MVAPTFKTGLFKTAVDTLNGASYPYGRYETDFRANVESKYSKLGLRILISFKNLTVFIAAVSTHELTSMLKSTVEIKIQKQRKQGFGGSMKIW